MTPIETALRIAAAELRARASPCCEAERADEDPEKNDRPDAIADCRVCDPQTQQRRGSALTTTAREARHPQTTNSKPLN